MPKLAVHTNDLTGNGGISRFARSVLDELRNDFDITLIGTKEDNSKFPDYKHYNYGFFRNNFLRKKFLNYLLVKADVFWYAKNYGTFRLFKKARVVVTVHDLMKAVRPDLEWGKKSLKRTLKRKIKLQTLRFADTLIVPSKKTSRDVKILFPRSEPIVIPHGVDLSHFQPLKKERVILCTDSKRFYKNIHMIEEAFQDTGLNRMGWELRISNNWDENRLRVEYGKAFCYVSASEFEGFGLGVLEAAASGCKLLLSKEYEDIFGDSLVATYVYEKGTLGGWFNSLRYVCSQFTNDKPERTPGVAYYSWNKIAEMYKISFSERKKESKLYE